MPTSVPVANVSPGNVLTSATWNAVVASNLNKLLNTGHRTLTVAQFAALIGLEGTKGTAAGDEVYLEVDATNGIIWHLVYESTEATYKWRFLGGPPMVALVDTAETISGGTYGDLATNGPAISGPRSGEYEVSFGSEATVAASTSAFTAIAATGSPASDTTRVSITNLTASAAMIGSVARVTKLGIASAGDTMKLQYRGSSAATQTFARRWIRVTPVRII